MALRHAILSSLSRGVAFTGYELSSHFADDNDRAWHAKPSQVYQELTKMAEAGLIEITERGERGKTHYRATKEGIEELRRWLVTDEPDHKVKDDPILRLLTMWLLDDDTAKYFIDMEIAFNRRLYFSILQSLKTNPQLQEDSLVWRNRRAVHALWLAQTDLMIKWLNALEDVLKNPRSSVDGVMADALNLSDI